MFDHISKHVEVRKKKYSATRRIFYSILLVWKFGQIRFIVFDTLIDHFTVVGLVAWPLNGSEAGGDLVLIQTSLLL